LNVALELHVAIATLEGTLMIFGVSLESVIVAAAVTGPLRVTVHVATESDESVLGVQTSDFSVTDNRLTEAVAELPLRLALTVAVPLTVMFPATALKLADVDPDGTLTDAGTVNNELLLESGTLAPPTGAA
jgi:hypothetical protein